MPKPCDVCDERVGAGFHDHARPARRTLTAAERAEREARTVGFVVRTAADGEYMTTDAHGPWTTERRYARVMDLATARAELANVAPEYEPRILRRTRARRSELDAAAREVAEHAPRLVDLLEEVTDELIDATCDVEPDQAKRADKLSSVVDVALARVSPALDRYLAARDAAQKPRES